ncbi:DUF1963 domain-containing protein [Patulibacter americanus]|uniref:DUF1963 domain-containing protein n=1 Tax=Patulibacter americanus TaxID=588672 RepID=UPI0003B56A89|nr:DUF1963 domain-containing protein [Patulibacter americanus]
MVDVAWRARAHELLREILVIHGAVPFDDVGGWIGRELSRARPPAVVRHATGTRVLTLDPYGELGVQSDAWIDEPTGGRRAAAGFDADGAIVSATSSWGRREEEEPEAVGWRLADGTPVLVTRGNFSVQARSVLADGSSVVVIASFPAQGPDDQVEELTVALATAEGSDGVRHTRAWAWTPTIPGRASVGVRVDRIVTDGEGRPVERWAAPSTDDDAPDDQDEAPVGRQVDELHVTDAAGLLDALVDLVAAAETPARQELRWSLRLHGPPPPLPAGDGAVEDAARAMLRTVRRAGAAAGLPAPCAVALTWQTDDGPWPGPLPELLVVDRAFADAYRALPDARSAAYNLHRARAAGEGVEISLLDHADDATLDAWTPLRRGIDPEDDDASAAAARRLAEVRRRLLELLLAETWPAPWVGPVLPWLAFGSDGIEDGAYGPRGLDPWGEIAAFASAEDLAALTDAWPPGPSRASDSDEDPSGARDDDPDGGDAEEGTFVLFEHRTEGGGRLEIGFGAFDHAPPGARPTGPGVGLSAGGGGRVRDAGDDEGFEDDEAASGASPDDEDEHASGDRWETQDDAPRPTDELTVQAAASRTAFRALLEREGLADAAARLADAARYGFALEPRPGARSRIAGPPLLPAGAAWPTTGDGEPLTFLAAIDLSELPEAPEPLPLPATGWLLVYVLLENPDPDEGIPGFVEGGPEAGTAVVLHVSGSAPPLEVADPPAVGVLRPQPVDAWSDEDDDPWDEGDEDRWDEDPDEADQGPSDDEGVVEGPEHGAPSAGPADPVAAQPIGFRLVLEPLQDYEVADRLGLHPSVEHRYDRIVGDLPDRWAHRAGPVQGTLLGADPGVQGHPVEDDEIVLLALAGTPELGLEWGDGGDLRVLIGTDDAAAGRWEGAWAVGDSC